MDVTQAIAHCKNTAPPPAPSPPPTHCLEGCHTVLESKKPFVGPWRDSHLLGAYTNDHEWFQKRQMEELSFRRVL